MAVVGPTIVGVLGAWFWGVVGADELLPPQATITSARADSDPNPAAVRRN
jgi:hypothetical protein